jgi:hypothetical protein
LNVRPGPMSPTASSPQYQPRRQGSGSAGSPGSEFGVRGGDNDFVHERGYARSDARGGPGSRNAAPARSSAAGRGAGPIAERPPSPQQAWSEEVETTPPRDAQPLSATDNILCAVLALIKELDGQGLELVRRAVEQRQEDGL